MTEMLKNQISNFRANVKKYFFSRSQQIVPRLLLFPITNRCNSRCVMCNVWQQKETRELSLDQIRDILDDPTFKTIEYVVLSGGEPSLREDIGSIAKLFVEKCPRLRLIDVPINGLVPELATKACYAVNEACKKSNVKFAFSISLDGLGDIHGRVRGVPNAFEKTVKTIETMRELKNKFDFRLHVHCVVTNANVHGLSELIDWVGQKRIPFSFELAHNWKRFMNENSQYHLTNKQKDIFLNVLWTQVKQSMGTEYHWMTYRMINSGKKRYLTCPFVVNAFSVHPDGNVYYCPGSESIGNVHEDKLSNIYYDKRNLEFREWIKRNECSSCTQSCWWYALNKNLLQKFRYNVIKRIITIGG
jgi:radical SAM protein with 4Fe4S-binding SPASM domain